MKVSWRYRDGCVSEYLSEVIVADGKAASGSRAGYWSRKMARCQCRVTTIGIRNRVPSWAWLV